MATFVKKALQGGTRWQAVVRLRGAKPLKKTFDLKGQAEAWAKTVEGDQGWAEALGSPGAKMTLAALAKDYEQAGKGRADRIRFWVGKLGTRRLSEITDYQIQSALDDYSAGTAEVFIGHGKTRPCASGKKRGPGARNRMRDQLASIFSWAEEKKLFKGNPAHEVARVTEPKGRTRALSQEEADRLITSAHKFVALARAKREAKLKAQEAKLKALGLPAGSGRPLKPIWEKLPLLIIMALATGARASELLGKVRWERIDWANRTVQIDDTKNTDSRVLVLPKAAIEELMRHRQKKGLVFARVEDAEKPFTVKKHWDAAVKGAGITDFHFHDQRHTAASWLVNEGVDLYTVGKVLGHRSLQSTARYAHLDVEAKKKAVDAVMTAARFGGEGPQGK